MTSVLKKMGRIVKMAYPGGGLYVVESEVCLLVTAMRRGARWSSHSHQVRIFFLYYKKKRKYLCFLTIMIIYL